jgi:ABC-type nitrate/sulfonate/bicarbonate transport system substrate-binding protein
MISRKELRRPEDLRGKSIGIARAGNISERLSKAVVKKFNIPENEVTIRPVGGSQSERFQAMRMNIVQAIVITPPLDVRAKNEGFNILYRLVDLGVPFVYSSVHANARMLRERPDAVQKVVAGFAEAIHFAEKNPDKAKAAVAKVMRTTDQEALQSSYDVYAKEIVDRRMIVPEKAVAETVEQTRQAGGAVQVRGVIRQQFRPAIGQKRFSQRAVGRRGGRIAALTNFHGVFRRSLPIQFSVRSRR